MWLWLQNSNKFNLNNFFKKVIIISLFIHLIVLIILLFGIKDKSLNLDIFLNKDLLNNPPVPIVFLPFAKNVPGSIEQLKRLAKVKKANKNKMVALKKSKKAKIIAKKAVSKKAIIIEKTNKKNKKEITKKAVPAEASREGLEVKKIKKELIKEPEIIKKPEVVKQEEPEKLPEITKSQEILELKEEVVNLDEPVAIYLGAKDMEGFALISGIQQEILRYWKPPMGLPKGIECKVNIKVDKDGKVENFKIEKSSKVLAYDISLRNAILKSIMPNEIRGREFTLTLNC